MKNVLVAAGLWAGSMAVWFASLVIGAIAAGRSRSGAEVAVVCVLLLELATLGLGGGVLFVRLKRAGVSLGARVGAGVGWLALSLTSVVGTAFITLVIFNR